MFDIHRERIAWAEDLWGIKLHPGQQRALRSAATTGTSLHLEVHDRRWGKSLLLMVDTLTWLLAYPESYQAYLTTGALAQMVTKRIQEMLQQAQSRPDACERFPHLPSLKICPSRRQILRTCQDTQEPCVVIGKAQMGLPLCDRVLVDETNYSGLPLLQEALRMVKPDGKLYLMGSSRRIATDTPLIHPQEAERCNRLIGED